MYFDASIYAVVHTTRRTFDIDKDVFLRKLSNEPETVLSSDASNYGIISADKMAASSVCVTVLAAVREKVIKFVIRL